MANSPQIHSAPDHPPSSSNGTLTDSAAVGDSNSFGRGLDGNRDSVADESSLPIERQMELHPRVALVARIIAVPMAATSRLYSAYEKVILENAQQVVAGEALARNATYLLPSFHNYLETRGFAGYIPDAEFTMEAFLSTVNLHSTLSDAILARHHPVNPSVPLAASLHNRYMRAMYATAEFKAPKLEDALELPELPRWIASSAVAPGFSSRLSLSSGEPTSKPTDKIPSTPISSTLTTSYTHLAISWRRILAALSSQLPRVPSSLLHLHQVASYLLACLSHTQILLELIALRTKGDKARWRTVTAVEAAKAFCRLYILCATGGRMVLDPPVPERDFDASVPAAGAGEVSFSSRAPPASLSAQLPIPSLPSVLSTPISQSPTTPPSPFGPPQLPPPQTPADAYLAKVALTDAGCIKPRDMVGRVRVGGVRWWGEVGYSVRGLLYVILLRRYPTRPLLATLTSLVLLVFSSFASRRHLLLHERPYDSPRLTVDAPSPDNAKDQEAQGAEVRGRKMTALERREYERRVLLLGYVLTSAVTHLLRSSTESPRPKLHSFVAWSSTKPIINLIGNVVKDYTYVEYSQGMAVRPFEYHVESIANERWFD
ncbi:Peroxisomal membrane protein pex16 [Gonapodya sp. JEL0774]|nr:Peroxisomal membrane protein pex16 [Gonapodya sp. JEL0774]